MDRLSEIRARCEAATPGPWFNFGDWLIHTETDVEHNGIPHEKTIGSVKAQNAALIAHAREDIPYLLSVVDRLNALHKREIIVTGEYAQRVIDLTARAEKAKAERDRAIKQMCRFCKSLDKKAGIKPVCAADCEWRGHQAGKGDAE